MHRASTSTPTRGGPSNCNTVARGGGYNNKMMSSKSSSAFQQDGDTYTSSSSMTFPFGGCSAQVAVRLRPIGEQEMKHGTLPVITVSTAEKTVRVIKSHGSRQAKSSFAFDNVLTVFSTQEEVYEGTLKPLISYVLKGFESTVFAYGQTVTGKTYTMEGELNSLDQQGMIPRAAHKIFNNLEQSQYKDPIVTCSYLEIYNADLCDLLVDMDDKVNCKHAVGDSSVKPTSGKLEILESNSGNFCRGLSEKVVSSAEDVLQLMQIAQQQRHIGESKTNKHSSRSHCIFSIRFHANLILPESGGTMEFNGKLHMVDLAGSECARAASFVRPNSTDAAREWEKMNINRSLLTLRRVIFLLKESSESKKTNIRIPYRDSKLTRILQESLGGSCKTVIIATLSPSISAIEESIFTLSYTQLALSIVNKLVSASLLSLNPGQSFPSTAGHGDNRNGNSVNAVEYWHEMECRIQYTHAQVEEAQTALGRKHLQQQELLERAQKAASECLETQRKLDKVKEEITVLSSSLIKESEKRKEAASKLEESQKKLQKTVLILNATKKTERRRTSEAKSLLSTLEMSICYCDSLYAALKTTFESEVSKRRATKSFHSESTLLLKESSDMLQKLSFISENQCRSVSTAATSSSDVTNLLNTITEQIKSMANAMTHQVSGGEGLRSIASDVSSKILYRLQTVTSTMAQGKSELSSTCLLAQTRLQQVSEQLIYLGQSHEKLRDESISTFEVAALGLKPKLGAVMILTEKAINDAETVRLAAHTEQEELLSRSKKDKSDSCAAISAKAENHSETLNYVETFRGERKHRNLAQRALEEQQGFVAKTGNDHTSKVSQQKSLILSNEMILQEAHKQQHELRNDCIQNIMNQAQDIANMQMLQLSHATEKQFESFKANTVELKVTNACIADSAQSILANVGGAHLYVFQQIGLLQHNDSSTLQMMRATSIGLDKVVEISKQHDESPNAYSSQVKQGLENLADLDCIAVGCLRKYVDDGQESVSFIEKSLHPETVSAMRSMFKSGDNILRFSCDSAISPTLEAIDCIVQPRKAIFNSMKSEEQETKLLYEQHTSFTSISENHKAFGEMGLKNVSLLTAYYQSVLAKESLGRATLLEQNLQHSASTLFTGQSKLVETVSSITDIVKMEITDFSKVTMKMDEDVSCVPDRLSFGYSKLLSYTLSEDEIIGNRKLPPLLGNHGYDCCNVELETTIDISIPRSASDDRLAENKENMSETASVESAPSSKSPPVIKVLPSGSISNKRAESSWLNKPLAVDQMKTLALIENDSSVSAEGIMAWHNMADSQVELEGKKRVTHAAANQVNNNNNNKSSSSAGVRSTNRRVSLMGLYKSDSFMPLFSEAQRTVSRSVTTPYTFSLKALQLKMFVLFVCITCSYYTTTTTTAYISTDNTSIYKNHHHPISIQNCSCYFFTQPLDHFSRSITHNKTFQQRYCVYDKFTSNYSISSLSSSRTTATAATNDDHVPIFFYTGNESPIEVYINNTGRMWTLGAKYHALLVFAEHRYEGKSVPIFLPTHDDDDEQYSCMTYCTSAQAIADYVSLLGVVLNPLHKRPVVAFGGSYGGMLAAWMRIKYPFAIAGAIASSAPIWGLPLTNPILDGASMAVANSVLLQYTTTAMNGPHRNSSNTNPQHNNYCFTNLLASWPLLTSVLAATKATDPYGRRNKISSIFHLCEPLSSSSTDEEDDTFLSWLQSPWFYLAEGNFPFTSNYIPYALLKRSDAYLPAWPIQEACSYLNYDFGISIIGSISQVNFDIVQRNKKTHTSTAVLHVDWDKLVPMQNTSMEDNENWDDTMEQLFVAIYHAISIWFNVTKEEECFDWKTTFHSSNTASPAKSNGGGLLSTFARNKHRKDNTNATIDTMMTSSLLKLQSRVLQQQQQQDDTNKEHSMSKSETCNRKIANEGCWSSVCCNEGIHLATVEGRGMGRDFFWPPTFSRGTTIQDLIHGPYSHMDDSSCHPPYYSQRPDPSSKWLDDYYGGLRLGMISNIVFTNGLLDPWSAAGVYRSNPFHAKEEEEIHHDSNAEIPTASSTTTNESATTRMSIVVQNITKDTSVISIILPMGAHHLDLMFPSDNDPDCVVEARYIQEDNVVQWLNGWNDQICVNDILC